MAELLHIKEVTRKNGLITTVSYDYDRETESVIKSTKAEYTSEDVYSYFLLNKESDEWVLRIYPVPNAEDNPSKAKRRFDAIFRDMKEFGTSIAYINKDSSFTAISIRDGDTPRLWDVDKKDVSPELENMVLENSNKLPKRLAMLGTQTYLNTDATVIVVDEDDNRCYPHHKGVLYIKITELPEHEAILKDGQYFIRPEVRDEMVESVYNKMHPVNPKKANRLRRHLGSSCTFNGRLVFRGGLIKGDALVSHVLNVDVLVDRVNIKPEVKTKDVHSGLFQMFPQEQMGNIVTNRQTIGSFYYTLMNVPTPNREDSQGLVKDAFSDYIEHLLDVFRSGEMMVHVDSLEREQKDSIRNVFEKLEAWTNAGFSVNESLYLSMMEAGQIVDMLGCTPGQDDRKRKFPVPYSVRSSIRNADTYRMVYGYDPDLAYGEAFVDPDYGIIMSDETYLDVIPVLGGADLDDHVEIHYRTAVDGDEFFGIEPGDTVMFIIRNPIGISSDGENIGSEFWVLKASAIERFDLPARYGELPIVIMQDRPLSTDELGRFRSTGPLEPSFTATDSEASEHYTKKNFMTAVKASASAQGIYGIHSNLMLACRVYNIPFPFIAPEETFVDICQQTRHPEDLSFIRDLNEVHQKMLANAGIPMDYWTKKRCGLRHVPEIDGLFTELVNYHRDGVDYFEEEAKNHIHTLKKTMERESVEVTRIRHGKPTLISYLETAEKRYRKNNNISANAFLSYNDFEQIGDYVINRISELEADSNQSQTPADTTQQFQEAHEWLLGTQVKPSHRTTSVRSMYYNTDQKLMAGAMFYRLIESLL